MNLAKEKIDAWEKAIYEYFTVLDKEKDASDVDAMVTEVYFNVLRDLMCHITKVAAPRDNWQLGFRGQHVVAQSRKLQHEFIFGSWLEVRFFLETPVLYPHHLGHMTDEFWRLMAELNDFGEFKFEESAVPPKPPDLVPGLPVKLKSNLYHMIQNFLRFEHFADIPLEEDIKDFGSLNVYWPCRTKLENLIQNSREAFKRMYQINYLLYRYEYLRQKGQDRWRQKTVFRGSQA